MGQLHHRTIPEAQEPFQKREVERLKGPEDSGDLIKPVSSGQDRTIVLMNPQQLWVAEKD